ncbi:hypothetical protein M3650_10220 [Paenibacillus sp. MER TA 81-3]|nr:hypothetical protein [Paenibacillus sp. MER TA 81-3]MCM3338998.1 hypothetical protein [Paenibacillus sp. MER TA 81-3]
MKGEHTEFLSGIHGWGMLPKFWSLGGENLVMVRGTKQKEAAWIFKRI